MVIAMVRLHVVGMAARGKMNGDSVSGWLSCDGVYQSSSHYPTEVSQVIVRFNYKQVKPICYSPSHCGLYFPREQCSSNLVQFKCHE
jgi:hypothetical protein